MTNEELIAARSSGATAGEIAAQFGVHIRTVWKRVATLREKEAAPEFTPAPVPSTDLPVEELIAHRKAQFSQLRAGKEARKLIPVKVNIRGPVGILTFGDPHCLTPDHEVLTKEGWKRHDALTKSDLIGGVDAEGRFCWQRMLRYIERTVDEPMVQINTTAISLHCTEKHRIYARKAISKGYEARQVYLADELTDSQFKIPTGAWKSPTGVTLADDEIRLLGWILTDAHWEAREGEIKAFTLYQSKPEGVAILKALLAALQLPHSHYSRERSGSHVVNGREVVYNFPEHTFRIGVVGTRRLARLFGLDPEVRGIPPVLWNFSADQFKVFLETVVLADGNRASLNTVRVYKDNLFIDTLQALCAAHSYRTKKYDQGATYSTLSITDAGDACVKPRYDVTREHYQGVVWCVTVEHGNFFTRRNGRVHLTGNCDDDGTDIGLIESHVQLLKNTEGLFGANIGDTTNNWMGRLARLYAEQSTSAKQAWQLAEWFIRSVDWLYFLDGNHGAWSGAGDPVKWILGSGTPHDSSGVRLNLQFPNKKEVRINARHTFPGHSMWNTTHGPSKAAQMGWRDHILIAGHTHVSGYQILKDPMTGMLSHAIRVGSYKTYDRYAEQLGLPDQCISPAVVTVIDPAARTETGLITVFHDVEEGAAFLTWKRQRKAA